jgi:hypothetical protein
MGIRIFTKLIHISWCGIIVLAVVGWALAAVLTPTTMALFEGCDVGNRVLSNATFFNETMDKFVVYNTTTGNKTDDGQMVADLLYRCYYGDGDVIDQLNLTQVFQVFRNVFEPLDNYCSRPSSRLNNPSSTRDYPYQFEIRFSARQQRHNPRLQHS